MQSIMLKLICIRILGSLPYGYYLESNKYVPERMLNSIDKKSSAMMASGLHQLYIKYGEFVSEMHSKIEHREDENDDEQALTMDQIKRPLILVFYLWGITLVVFIIENLVYYIKKRSRWFFLIWLILFDS